MACPCRDHNPDGSSLDPEDEGRLESIISAANEEIDGLRKAVGRAKHDYIRARVELGDYVDPDKIREHPDWGAEGAWYADFARDGKVYSVIVKPGDDATLDLAFEKAWERALRGRRQVSSFLASHLH